MFRTRFVESGFRVVMAPPSELLPYATLLKQSLSPFDRQSLNRVSEDLIGRGLVPSSALRMSSLVELAFSFDKELPERLQCLATFDDLGIQATPQAYHDLVLAAESAAGVAEAEKVALEMMEKELRPLPETWHLLMAKQDTPEGRRRILQAMIASRGRPDKEIFGFLLGDNHSFEQALQEVRNAGGAANLYTCNALLDALAEVPLPDEVEGLLAFMKEVGLRASPYSYHSLVTARAKAASLESAVGVLERMESEGVRPILQTYNCLAEGLALAGEFEGALGIARKIDEVEGLAPSTETFNGILKGHSQHTGETGMKTTLQLMGARALDADLQTFEAVKTTLKLHTSSEAADLDEVLKELEAHNVPIVRDVWHCCMLHGFQQEGTELKDIVLDMYTRMQTALGDRPNRITYNILLQWFAKNGLEQEAEMITLDMLDKVRIRPSPYTLRILESLPNLRRRIEDEVSSRLARKRDEEEVEWQRRAGREQRLAT